MANHSTQLAQTLLEKYGALDGENLLRNVLNEISMDKICLVSSFGTESAVLLHMVSQISPNFKILFLDTKKLFPETLEYRDTLIEHLGLKNVTTIYPDYADVSYSDPDGTLWERDTNNCCTIRKVRPLQKALKPYDAWITGRKRYHGGIRSNMPLIESFEGRIKINPLANQTAETIQVFFDQHNLPPHPLLAQGYLSVGCAPCTDLPATQKDARSGRWKDTDQQECGIHLGEDGKFKPARSER